MNVGDVLNGYRILTPPTNAGGGMSRWSFAERDGREYFVKMFLAPRYPLPELPGSEEVKAAKRVACERFEQRHLEIAERLAGDTDGGSNLVIPRDFFRVGSTYVKVMDRVRPTALPPRAELTDQQILVLLRTLCVNLRVLHRQGIVHGDLKPDNVMTELRGAVYVAKLIDFDEAYLAGEPPPPDEMVGDPAFYAPEQLAYIKGLAPGTALGLPADMYAIGLLVHVLLAARAPSFDRTAATYPCEVVLEGATLGLGPVPPAFVDLLGRLLARDPAARPTVDDVIAHLVDLPPEALSAPPIEVPGSQPPVPVEPTPAPTQPVPVGPSSALRSTIGRRRAANQE